MAKAINDKTMEYRSRAFLFVLGLSSVHASTEARLSRVCSDPIAHVSTGGRLGDVTSAAGERGIGGALFNQEPRRKHVIGVLAIASKLQLPWLALMALIPNLSTSFALHGAALMQLLESRYSPKDVSALECWYSCSPRYCAHVLSIRF